VASFRPSVVMASALSSLGSIFLRPQPLVAFDQLLLEGVLLLRHRAGNDDGLAAFEAGPGQVQHLGRLHVGKGPEHLLKFGQVGEAGEPAAWPEPCAVGRDFHRVDDFAEGSGPGVEMLDAAALESLGVEESHHCVHFHHAVGNRRPCGKCDSMT